MSSVSHHLVNLSSSVKDLEGKLMFEIQEVFEELTNSVVGLTHFVFEIFEAASCSNFVTLT